jgi:hypothetical protein
MIPREPLLGDRVRIVPACPWAKGATGQVIGGIAGDCMRFRRTVRNSDGLRTFYLVAFDQPQLDAEGDGPYIGAEIESRYIELVLEAA